MEKLKPQKKLLSREDQLADGRKKLDDGWAKIEESRKKLAEGMRKYEEGERDYQAGMTQLEAGKSKLVSQMGASSYEDAVEKIYAIDKALETGEDLLKKLPTIEGEISKTSSQISQVDRGLSQIDGQLSALKNSLNNPDLTGEERKNIEGQIAGLEGKNQN